MFLGNFVKRLGQVMDVSAIKMKYYYYYYYDKGTCIMNTKSIIIKGIIVNSMKHFIFVSILT